MRACPTFYLLDRLTNTIFVKDLESFILFLFNIIANDIVGIITPTFSLLVQLD